MPLIDSSLEAKEKKRKRKDKTRQKEKKNSAGQLLCVYNTVVR